MRKSLVLVQYKIWIRDLGLFYITGRKFYVQNIINNWFGSN
jgi:hypothetical protein